MKPLRNVAACALACAVVSAAPTIAVQPGATPATAQAAPKPGEPEWVESMQRLVKDLTDDNQKLRWQVMDLQDQNDFLSRKLEECQVLLEKHRANRGALNAPNNVVTPPGAQSDHVPPGWKPFEFNGATYYVVPLEHRAPEAKRATITLPEATK